MEKQEKINYPTLEQCRKYVKNGFSDKKLSETDEHIIGSLWAYIEDLLSKNIVKRSSDIEDFVGHVNCKRCTNKSPKNCLNCGDEQAFVNFHHHEYKTERVFNIKTYSQKTSSVEQEI